MLKKIHNAQRILNIVCLITIVFGTGALQNTAFALILMSFAWTIYFVQSNINKYNNDDPTCDPVVRHFMSRATDGHDVFTVSPNLIFWCTRVILAINCITIFTMRFAPFKIAAFVLAISLASTVLNWSRDDSKIDEALEDLK